MRANRPSETALKVALAMVTLAKKPGWQDKLPAGIADLSEQLILSAGAFGYNSALMRLSKKQWAVGFYDGYEKFMPGIFEGLGERTEGRCHEPPTIHYTDDISILVYPELVRHGTAEAHRCGPVHKTQVVVVVVVPHGVEFCANTDPAAAASPLLPEAPRGHGPRQAAGAHDVGVHGDGGSTLERVVP